MNRSIKPDRSARKQPLAVFVQPVMQVALHVALLAGTNSDSSVGKVPDSWLLLKYRVTDVNELHEENVNVEQRQSDR